MMYTHIHTHTHKCSVCVYDIFWQGILPLSKTYNSDHPKILSLRVLNIKFSPTPRGLLCGVSTCEGCFIEWQGGGVVCAVCV